MPQQCSTAKCLLKNDSVKRSKRDIIYLKRSDISSRMVLLIVKISAMFATKQEWQTGKDRETNRERDGEIWNFKERKTNYLRYFCFSLCSTPTAPVLRVPVRKECGAATQHDACTVACVRGTIACRMFTSLPFFYAVSWMHFRVFFFILIFCFSAHLIAHSYLPLAFCAAVDIRCM